MSASFELPANVVLHPPYMCVEVWVDFLIANTILWTCSGRVLSLVLYIPDDCDVVPAAAAAVSATVVFPRVVISVDDVVLIRPMMLLPLLLLLLPPLLLLLLLLLTSEFRRISNAADTVVSRCFRQQTPNWCGCNHRQRMLLLTLLQERPLQQLLSSLAPPHLPPPPDRIIVPYITVHGFHIIRGQRATRAPTSTLPPINALVSYTAVSLLRRHTQRPFQLLTLALPHPPSVPRCLPAAPISRPSWNSSVVIDRRATFPNARLMSFLVVRWRLIGYKARRRLNISTSGSLSDQKRFTEPSNAVHASRFDNRSSHNHRHKHRLYHHATARQPPTQSHPTPPHHLPPSPRRRWTVAATARLGLRSCYIRRSDRIGSGTRDGRTMRPVRFYSATERAGPYERLQLRNVGTGLLIATMVWGGMGRVFNNA